MANPLSEEMSDILCTKFGIHAVNKTISQILSKDTEAAQLFKILRITGVKRQKTREYGDAMTRVFNRTLMLPLGTQKMFLDLVSSELEKLKSSIEKYSYQPIVGMI